MTLTERGVVKHGGRGNHAMCQRRQGLERG